MEGLIMLLGEISHVVRGCVFEVYRQLGCGFLEKVYERALITELELQGLQAKAQVPITIHYKNKVVGEYFADLIVEGLIILELKAQPQISPASEAQLLNYLKASGIRLGMLVNFAFPKASIRRIIL
jgi:GxxExxY protein